MSLGLSRSRALSNLVMALSSYQDHRSVVELSLSPLYHYQYSSITDCISELSKDEKEWKKVQGILQRFYWDYYTAKEDEPITLQSDWTPLVKAHSATLEGRGYVPIPNRSLKDQQPVEEGYSLSSVNLCAEKGWSLPLSLQRVSLDQTANECMVEQLNELLSHPDLGLSEKFVINLLDSGYGAGSYLVAAYELKNMVSIVRLKSGMKVWKQDYQTRTGGGPRYYGQHYYLIAESGPKPYKNHPKHKGDYEVFQNSVFEAKPDQEIEFDHLMANGRAVKVQTSRWNNMLLRPKGYEGATKDKPFDLAAIKVYDASSGKLIFGKGLFLAIWGEKKDQIPTDQIHGYYRKRYDIEPTFRFEKQKLLLDKFQTPDVQHFDNWLFVVQMAMWLLYTASDEVSLKYRKWEQYLPQNQNDPKPNRLSPAQTRKAAQDLFLTFDQTPFIPRKSKGGPGRLKGKTFTPRKRYEVNKKHPNKNKTQLNCQKNE